MFGSQVKLADGRTVTADDNYVRESILNPLAKVVAGYDPVMPTFQGQVTEEQLTQLIAYVRSLGPTGAAPAGGTGGTPAAGTPAASGVTNPSSAQKDATSPLVNSGNTTAGQTQGAAQKPPQK